MDSTKKITSSREQEALDAISKTSISRKLAIVATIVFSALLFAVPAFQLCTSMPSFENPDKTKATGLKRILEYNNNLIDKKNIWEDDMKQQSFLQNIFPSAYQTLLTECLHTGNEKAITGEESDWMFYEKDIKYYQTPINFESINCITDLNEQLNRHGIKLLLLPVPLKPAFHADKLSNRYSAGSSVVHPDFSRWKNELTRRGVSFVPLPDTLRFLKKDTHWDVESMEKVSECIAEAILGSGVTIYEKQYSTETETVANMGDIYSMLKLKRTGPLEAIQSLKIHQVINEYGELFQPSRNSNILFLGDSFSNIYSLQGMGWGNSAGLVEHLAYCLQSPVDAIRRNDEGSFATRKILQNELKSGKDRLEGKDIVIWEFAERELAFGNWSKLDMTLGKPVPTTFVTVSSGDSMTVTGTIADRSASPLPDKVTYADHIIALHLTDLNIHVDNDMPGEAVVYTFGMKNHELTPSAFLRTGDRIHVTLKSWQDKEPEFGGLNRNELDDFELQLQEPVWGENIQRLNEQ